MAICKELSNLGASQCGFPMKVARRLIFVPLINELGDANMVPLQDVNKLATWEPAISGIEAGGGLIHKLSRFYVLPNMENVEDTRADTEFYEWNSGQKVRIRPGVRTFTGAIPNETPSLLGKLQMWEGQAFGVYIIDTGGNLIFNYLEKKSETGVVSKFAAPIAVDGNSFDAKYVKPTYSDPLHIMVQFDFSADVNDKDLYMVPLASLDFDGRTSQLYALTDVYADDSFVQPIQGGWSDDTHYHLQLFLDYNTWAGGFTDEDFSYSGGAITSVTETHVPAPNEGDSFYTIVVGTAATGGETITFSSKGYEPFVGTPYTP